MLFFLRWLRHALLRGRDAMIGSNYAVQRRLEKEGRAVVGDQTYGNPIIKTYIADGTKLYVGKYCALSETAIVMLGGQHPVDTVSQYPFRLHWKLPGAGEDGNPVPSEDTHIGNDVIINQRAFIRSGVTIGDGAVIGANANVVKDVPAYAIMGGNPARVIRYRATPEQIEALLEIKWWDWSREDIMAALDLITGTDIDAFIAHAHEKFGTPAAWPALAGK
ncbi:MAG: CatB-related O-acetyltransferase [Nocardioidaceae bacterium]|nr:CatB-related O-acetyltransferase [Nocardioidaceae bacterium]MCL2614162.1 CatB-related O-acetyltransferase [Nocardioidaceae bacterium]